jgi:hypothetical protein
VITLQDESEYRTDVITRIVRQEMSRFRSDLIGRLKADDDCGCKANQGCCGDKGCCQNKGGGCSDFFDPWDRWGIWIEYVESHKEPIVDFFKERGIELKL